MGSVVRRLTVIALAGAVLASLAAVPAAAAPSMPRAAIAPPGTSIVVTKAGDAPDAEDGACSFSEAIVAANQNQASGPVTGECPAGSADGVDIITFLTEGTDVTLPDDAPQITSDLVIQGGNLFLRGPGRPFDIAAGAAVTLKGVKVADTSGTSAGGAMRVAGTATLEDAVFFFGSSMAQGGAVLVASSGTLTAVRTAFEANSAAMGGGAIWNEGSVTLTDVSIKGNTGDGDGGGGIYNAAGASLAVRTSRFEYNGAPAGDGGAIVNLGTASIANSLIFGNTAGGTGGGVRNAGALAMIHVTIIANGASSGAGITTTGPAMVKNTVIVGNSLDGLSSGIDGSFDGGSTGNLTALPAGTGIDTWFEPSGYLPRKVADSPVLDKANDTVCADGPILRRDIRGLARPVGKCDIGAFERDQLAPVVSTAPRVSFRTGQQLAGSSALARVSWAGSDPGAASTPPSGTGISWWQLQVRVDGGAWTNALPDIVTETTFENVRLQNGKSYRFRARATDDDRNVSAWSYGPTFTARLVQQSSSAITYRGTWSRGESTKYSGGSVRYSRERGASATYTATGRAFTFVTTTGPTRGKAKIYVNGVLKTTVDLYSATTRHRVQAWSARYSASSSRSIRIVVSGTSGRPRVDLDAFYVMR